MLEAILFRAWLNYTYPRAAVPIGPLIDRLLAEQRQHDARDEFHELVRLLCEHDLACFAKWSNLHASAGAALKAAADEDCATADV